MASRKRPYRRSNFSEMDGDDSEDLFDGDSDASFHLDDEIEIAEKKPPKSFKGRSVRPPTFYHKRVILREYSGSDAATLKMLELECLQTIRTHALGSTKLTDKLIEYDDRVKQIAEETNQSVSALLQKACVLSPEKMHQRVVDKASGKFAADYDRLDSGDKQTIFGRYYEPGHKRRKG